MIRITLCRCGTRYKINRGAKGQFVKEFSNLNEFVRWFDGRQGKLFCPNIDQELSKHEHQILIMKTRGYMDKTHKEERELVRRKFGLI